MSRRFMPIDVAFRERAICRDVKNTIWSFNFINRFRYRSVDTSPKAITKEKMSSTKEKMNSPFSLLMFI